MYIGYKISRDNLTPLILQEMNDYSDRNNCFVSYSSKTGFLTIVKNKEPTQTELDLQENNQKQTKLQSQLDELMTAHNQAVMLGDTELAEQLKTEYQSLVNGS